MRQLLEFGEKMNHYYNVSADLQMNYSHWRISSGQMDFFVWSWAAAPHVVLQWRTSSFTTEITKSNNRNPVVLNNYYSYLKQKPHKGIENLLEFF